MIFQHYDKLYQVLNESTRLKTLLDNNLRPEISQQILQILTRYSNSPLVKYIISRLYNNNESKSLKIGIVDTLPIYELDPVVFKELYNIEMGDIGPGEILVSLSFGEWKGGSHNSFDVFIEDIGKIEIKSLGPFAKSTNVPLGSAKDKQITDSNLEKFIKKFNIIISKYPELIKKYLSKDEQLYFIDDTLDQIRNTNKDLSTNSIRLIGKILRHGSYEKVFKNNSLTYSHYIQYMEDIIKSAFESVDYIMFLGYITKRNKHYNQEKTVYDGQYYIMPKNDIKYYMLYRLLSNSRIKMAPFTTEKDFYEIRLGDYGHENTFNTKQ